MEKLLSLRDKISLVPASEIESIDLTSAYAMIRSVENEKYMTYLSFHRITNLIIKHSTTKEGKDIQTICLKQINYNGEEFCSEINLFLN
jgi:hypothetical protein